MIAVSIAMCLGLCVAIVLVFRTAASNRKRSSLPLTARCIDDISVERYRPMTRLLSQEDFRFLRSQPGYTPKLESRFRAHRCRIFHGYLTSLRSDFRWVCTALKILMLQSNFDRPDLASALMRNQMVFTWGIARVRCQLLLYRFGIGTVDASSLVKLLDGMRLELRAMVAGPVLVRSTTI
jgi:hypothetical protein